MGKGNEIARERVALALVVVVAVGTLATGIAWTAHVVRAAPAAGSTAKQRPSRTPGKQPNPSTPRPAATPPAGTGGSTATAGATPSPPPPGATTPTAAITAQRDATLSRMARGRVITGATTQRILLFTFDDGPHASTTPRLLDTLDREGIKAVFFVVAHRIRTTGTVHQRQREILQDIVRRGHWVANHSVTHRTMPALDPPQAAHEMNEAARLIELVTGARPWLFRPPGGGRSARIDRMLENAGYTIAMWNLGTGDPFVRTAREVRHTFGRVLDRRARMGQRGGVILLHDTHSWSIEAVPMILADVRRRNCELLAAGDRELFVFLDDPMAFFSARAEGDRPGIDAPPAALPAAQYEALQVRERERAARYCAPAASATSSTPPQSPRPAGTSE